MGGDAGSSGAYLQMSGPPASVTPGASTQETPSLVPDKLKAKTNVTPMRAAGNGAFSVAHRAARIAQCYTPGTSNLDLAMLSTTDSPAESTQDLVGKHAVGVTLCLDSPRPLHASVNAGSQHNEMDVNLIKSPAEVFEYIVHTGELKDEMPIIRQALLAVIAGCYLGFGFSCCMICGGQMPTLKAANPGLQSLLFGIYGFPVGLVLILICGADLFTSNTCYMLAALCEGKTTVLKLVRVWLVSYFFNLCGCIFMAQIFAWSTVFDNKKNFPIFLTEFKTEHTFGQTVVKGILANWMVNLAVLLASSSRDLCGKVVGVIMPISAFVSMGFEHCIANMFLFPLGMFLGSPVTVAEFITKNLIPATIGNVIGGGVFVGVFYALIFGRAGKALEEWEGAAVHALQDKFHVMFGGHKATAPRKAYSNLNLGWTKEDVEAFDI